MKNLVFCLLFSTVAFAQQNKIEGTGNNVNICQPKIIVKSCGSCCNKKAEVVVKEVVKKVEVPVIVEKEVVREVLIKTPRIKNRISLLGGVGALGNLKEESEPGKVKYSTEIGPVFGLQYTRDFGNPDASYSKHWSGQIQTNSTILFGLGVGW
jgi:hypothetical protein